MKRFRVSVLNRETGEPDKLTLDAPSEEAAVKMAADRGCVVESVTLLSSERPTPERPTPVSPPPQKVVPSPKADHDRSLSRHQGTAIILLLLVGLGVPFFGQFRPTPKWQYTIESPPDKDLQPSIDRLGADGWELVSARRAVAGSGESSEGRYEMIFKRPRQ